MAPAREAAAPRPSFPPPSLRLLQGRRALPPACGPRRPGPPRGSPAPAPGPQCWGPPPPLQGPSASLGLTPSLLLPLSGARGSGRAGGRSRAKRSEAASTAPRNGRESSRGGKRCEGRAPSTLAPYLQEGSGELRRAPQRPRSLRGEHHLC